METRHISFTFLGIVLFTFKINIFEAHYEILVILVQDH